MLKVVFVGAGSVEFTSKLVTDLLTYPQLRSIGITLHDIDPERLRTAERVVGRVAEASRAEPTIEASENRASAIAGADFVINTVQVGGARATGIDFAVPERFGLRYTINDTINVGGVFRGLRSIPLVLGLADDMERHAPGAWLLNYTNPMSILVWAVAAQSSIRAVGLCHSVFGTVQRLAEYVGVAYEDIVALSGGINHLAFILELRRRGGEDLYPVLRRVVADGGVPDDDLVRAELYRRLGYYPTESSEHHAEYNPWFIPKEGLVERFHIPIGEYLRRVDVNLARHDAASRIDAPQEPVHLQRSGEHAAPIIHAALAGTPEPIVGNMMNRGGLIENLPPDACVEVPCLADGLGVHPIGIGRLPSQCAAYIGPAIEAQRLTVEAALRRDRQAIYHAVMQDPLVQARLTLDEVWRLTDDLIAAEAEWLPEWLGGRTGELA